MTETTVGPNNGMFPTVQAALNAGCPFIRAIEDTSESGFTVPLNQPSMVYIDPGVTHNVTSQVTANSDFIYLGNDHQNSSLLTFSAPGVPFISAAAGTNVSFRHMRITNLSTVDDSSLVSQAANILVQNVRYDAPDASHGFLGDSSLTPFNKLWVNNIEITGGGDNCDLVIDIPEASLAAMINGIMFSRDGEFSDGSVVITSANQVGVPNQPACGNIIWTNLFWAAEGLACIFNLSCNVSNVVLSQDATSPSLIVNVYESGTNAPTNQRGAVVNNCFLRSGSFSIFSAPSTSDNNVTRGVSCNNVQCEFFFASGPNCMVSNVTAGNDFSWDRTFPVVGTTARYLTLVNCVAKNQVNASDDITLAPGMQIRNFVFSSPLQGTKSITTPWSSTQADEEFNAIVDGLNIVGSPIDLNGGCYNVMISNVIADSWAEVLNTNNLVGKCILRNFTFRNQAGNININSPVGGNIYDGWVFNRTSAAAQTIQISGMENVFRNFEFAYPNMAVSVTASIGQGTQRSDFSGFRWTRGHPNVTLTLNGIDCMWSDFHIQNLNMTGTRSISIANTRNTTKGFLWDPNGGTVMGTGATQLVGLNNFYGVAPGGGVSSFGNI
jgi:hypothetical protein